MGKIRIFRLTNAGDDENTEFIDFNGTTEILQNTELENAFIRSIDELDSDGIGNNQGAETPLGDQQALDKIEDVITIDGFISKRNGDLNDGFNAFIGTLRLWAVDEKITDDWDLGRFGLIVDDDHHQDLEPDGAGVPVDLTIALLWLRIEWKSDLKANQENFKIFFRVNKGDGT